MNSQLNPEERRKLHGMCNELVNSMIRVQAEKDLQKDIVNRAKDELEITPKIVRAMARIAYKNSLSEQKIETEELFHLYEQTFDHSLTQKEENGREED